MPFEIFYRHNACNNMGMGMGAWYHTYFNYNSQLLMNRDSLDVMIQNHLS